MSIRKYWPITNNDVYVKVFDEILDELDHSFFDSHLVNSYRDMTPECRYLVTRLYIRTAKWVRKEDLEKYMSPNTLSKVTDTLVGLNWLLSTPPLEILLADVASQRELQDLAKILGIQKAANMPRAKLAEELIQMEKQQALFNSGKIATKIRSLLQIECYFLEPSKRQFLFKLEQMFLYPVGPDATLEVIFLTHMKKQSYYKYKYVNQRLAPMFKSVESFESYASAREICKPIEEALALTQGKIPDHLTSIEHLKKLESGLQVAIEENYREAAYCYGRGVFNMSQLLMKCHRFIDEYAWVQKYLDQPIHKSKRGVALIRKLLLELRFLTESQTTGESSWLISAVNTYYDASAEVSDIELIDLQRKTVKLISSIRNTGLKSALSFITPPETLKSKLQIPIFEVIAVPLSSEAGGRVQGAGTKLVFDDGASVEQLALSRYEGYKGGHYENSIILTVFWLLFYDFLFDDPSQFHCAYQTAPRNTQLAIDKHKVQMLDRISREDIHDTVLDHRRTLVKDTGDVRPYMGGINWLIPESCLSPVMKGVGQLKLRLILERLMGNYFKYSSGFPDLTIWSTSEQRIKFVEVKSENDTISDNQLLWMEFLMEAGLDVELCKVTPEKRATKRKRVRSF